ncbi:MAG: energy-coupling factor ABC transporter ATP-binding protein [Gemmatimonadales bacterium]
MTEALRLDAVSFAYTGRPAVVDVSFALAAGARAALVGHNGAGKSTVMRLVTGLLRPATGTVWVGDWIAGDRRPDELARRVGSLFQHADQQLFARTVHEDVAFGPRAIGVPEPEVATRVKRALAALDLESVADQHPYDLPPPARKLAALAGALALEPALLLLDEPTAGLDRRARTKVTRALTERADAGVALLVITHDLGFAAEAFDRALVLERGRLVADAPLAELLGTGVGPAPWGLAAPPLAELSAALRLPGRPLRERDVARALAERCRP